MYRGKTSKYCECVRWALMYSHKFLKISEIIASNWSLKRRTLQAELFFWADWKAPNY